MKETTRTNDDEKHMNEYQARIKERSESQRKKTNHERKTNEQQTKIQEYT